MAKKKKKATSSGKKRRITVSFTWSGLFSTAVLIVLSIVWAFILGIIVGRGYSPESLFPKLAGLMPQAESQTAEQTAAKNQGEQVLKPEELGFFETLQQGSAKSRSGSGQSASEQRPQAEAEQGRKTAASRSGSEKASASGPVYRYVYQVASFKSAEKASRLQDRLRAQNIDSEISAVRVDKREWYRIIVPFEGQPGETSQFKAELRRLGLHQPLLRNKKLLSSR